jgi:hypothetical protein
LLVLAKENFLELVDTSDYPKLDFRIDLEKDFHQLEHSVLNSAEKRDYNKG